MFLERLISKYGLSPIEAEELRAYTQNRFEGAKELNSESSDYICVWKKLAALSAFTRRSGFCGLWV